MHIDPASDTPIFQQIASAIREAIAAGVYRSGDTIPSIRAMAIDLLVNPNTVARAYDLLEREGLIVAVRGVGMVVSRRTENAARDRTVQDMESGFLSGIQTGRRAGLDRKRIDAVYRQAWTASSPPPPPPPPPKPSSAQEDS
jgi:GntR family transcriptional regulator